MVTFQILAISLAAVLGLMTLVWILSLVRRDAGVVDVFWGLGFAVCAWLYYVAVPENTIRGAVVATLATLWGVRLAVYIWWRGRGKSEDYRYGAMRERQGERFAIVSLFTVFLLQASIMWIVSTPLLLAQSNHGRGNPTWLDALALVVFSTGFWLETVADWQLLRFKRDPENRSKLLTTGLRRYSRHPNYFGDALVWWSFYLFAASAGGAWSIHSPLLMTFLLMKVSGIPLLEKRLRETRPDHRPYLASTNKFFPWFPKKVDQRRNG